MAIFFALLFRRPHVDGQSYNCEYKTIIPCSTEAFQKYSQIILNSNPNFIHYKRSTPRLSNRPPHPAQLAAQRELRKVSTKMRELLMDFLLYAVFFALIVAICIVLNGSRVQMQNQEFSHLLNFNSRVRKNEKRSSTKL